MSVSCHPIPTYSWFVRNPFSVVLWWPLQLIIDSLVGDVVIISSVFSISAVGSSPFKINGNADVTVAFLAEVLIWWLWPLVWNDFDSLNPLLRFCDGCLTAGSVNPLTPSSKSTNSGTESPLSDAFLISMSVFVLVLPPFVASSRSSSELMLSSLFSQSYLFQINCINMGGIDWLYGI